MKDVEKRKNVFVIQLKRRKYAINMMNIMH